MPIIQVINENDSSGDVVHQVEELKCKMSIFLPVPAFHVHYLP